MPDTFLNFAVAMEEVVASHFAALCCEDKTATVRRKPRNYHSG